MIPFAAYCDGGCIGPNPSRLGGTFAWCWVNEQGMRFREGSGILEPEDLGVEAVTNQHTELAAFLRCVEGLPEGWAGTVYTDSEVTLWRMTTSHSFKNIPDWMKKKALDLRRGVKWTAKLLAGHPSRRDLERGFKVKKNGRKHPVSDHNKYCDTVCGRLAKDFRLWLEQGR